MYIYETPNWTNFTWDIQPVLPLIEDINKRIGKLSGRLSSIGLDNSLLQMVDTITNDVVASSEIEGVALNRQEVRSSVARKLGVTIDEPTTPTHYVEGIVEMMLDAVTNTHQSLTEERLFGWHCCLFPTGHSGLQPIHTGAYRTEEMQVVSGAFGRERVHYRAPEAKDVPVMMTEFLRWLNSGNPAPSVIKSAIAHLWFVCIHPFDDGNGRIARALSDMVLAQADGCQFRYFSMSKQINHEKTDYYQILEQTSRGTSNITNWISWYLGCMCRALEDADTALSTVLNKSTFWQVHSGVAISNRQSQMLNKWLDGYNAKLTIKNWAKYANVSADTAARDIKDLIDKHILRPTPGRVRDVAYQIIYTANNILAEGNIENRDGYYYLCISYNATMLSERISTLDKQRLDDGEVSIADLIDKYFAYLSASISVP